MKRHRLCRILAICSTLLFSVFFGYKQVFAHGEGKQLEVAEQPIGDLSLSVWSTPDILRPGEIHFIATISDNASLPVLDCKVVVRVTSDVDPSFLQESEASIADLSVNGTYEAMFDLNEPGIYQVEVEVTEPKNLTYLSNFNIQVVPVSLLAKGLIQFQIGLSIVIGAWLLQQGLVIFGVWKPAKIVNRRRN
jgi:hypothetical protein